MISNSLEKMLDETPEAYYWTGFLAADGCFSKNNKQYLSYRMTLHLGFKDKMHIEKFSQFISYPIRFGKLSAGISVMDKKYVTAIMKKFDFKDRKTYNPPTKLYIRDINLFLSFLIGYIDGDGCIVKQAGRADARLTIKCHKTWGLLIENWFCRLYTIVKPAFIRQPKYTTVEGKYAQIVCANSEVLIFLKQKIDELNLPAMNRKWNNVNTSSFRYKKSAQTKTKIRDLYKKGMKQKNICQLLSLSKGYVSRIINNEVGVMVGGSQ